jgi:hypothetical protein
MAYQLNNAPKWRLDIPSNSAFSPAFSPVGLLNNSGVGGSEKAMGAWIWGGSFAS